MALRTGWWRDAIVYQIYPKSFRDASGDGVGDLRGVIEGLAHLERLGVDAVWLSPIFASPMIDNGYDISDYTAINPLFGTMADFEEMLAEGKRRGIRFILDIALNHSSSAHPWFQAALSDPMSPYRDFYIWRDVGEGGALPNDWRSWFSGPAWTQPTGDPQCYLHLFDRSQPDLNWENPAVREAIYAAMRFWLDKGVGGFRLDVVSLIAKPPGLPSGQGGDPIKLATVFADEPRLYDHLREMRREVFDHYHCVALGETPYITPAQAARMVDPADPMLDVIYHFDLVTPPKAPEGGWDRAAFKRVFDRWQAEIGPRGWNTVVLSNHDVGRIVSRYGDGEGPLWRESATMLQTLVLLMRGTPFLYQGDELAMTNCPFERLEEIDDVAARNAYRHALADGASEAEALRLAARITRDHARTPFQWSAAAHAGFTAAARPWLKANPNHARLNLEAEEADDASPLAHARRLIALRRADALWREGAYANLASAHPDAFVFARRLGERQGVVALNLRDRETAVADLPSAPPTLCNYAEAGAAEVLRPYEARVWA